MKLEKATARITISRMRERYDQWRVKQNMINVKTLIHMADIVCRKIKKQEFWLTQHALTMIDQRWWRKVSWHIANMKKNLHLIEYWRRRWQVFIIRTESYTYIFWKNWDLITVYDTINWDFTEEGIEYQEACIDKDDL